MLDQRAEISVRGRVVAVPSVQIGDRTVVVPPGWLKICEVKDEAWLESESVAAPDAFLASLRRSGLRADLFTFAQRLPHTTPKYDYPMEWDNVAAIPLSEFSVWWERRVPTETRKNVRRAAKRGVVVRETILNDDLVRGIVEINNGTAVRQGRVFWHYGKSVEEVYRDYATLLDRSVYLAAYHGPELIGFMKMVYTGQSSAVLQLLCKPDHADKRPANALMAKAVEICCAKRFTHLIYGQYVYGNKRKSSLTEFKRRNGFEEVGVPRYYVPLTMTGRIALAFGLHHGWRALIPGRVMDSVVAIRAAWYRRHSRTEAPKPDDEASVPKN